MSKVNYKKSLREFEEWCTQIEQETSYDPNETDKDQQDRIKRARKDYNYFVRTYFPHYADTDCAKFHIECANKLLKYKKIRLIQQWFRGAAKSVHANIFYPLWLKIQEGREINLMVLVGVNYDGARTLLSDLQAELQSNQLLIRDFGEQYNLGHWEDGEFTSKDGVMFRALGRGQKPRGLRNRQHRVDYISFDDVDDDEIVLNENRVDRIVKWFFTALLLTTKMGRARVVVSNNLIHAKSILAKLIERYEKTKKGRKAEGVNEAEKDAKIHISKVNVKDKNGNITWPENYTEEDIEDMEAELSFAEAQTELHNNPIREGKTFKKAWLQFGKCPPPKRVELVAYLDGGFKNTANSDTKSLVCGGLYKGVYYIYKVYCGKATIQQMIDWHYDLYKWLEDHNAKAMWYMEEKFLLDLLYEYFDNAAEKYGYPIPIGGDKRAKENKDFRIEATSGLFEKGRVVFNKNEEGNHHMSNLHEQYLAFEPGVQTMKDGPDAMEGLFHIAKARVVSSTPPKIGIRKPGKKRF